MKQLHIVQSIDAGFGGLGLAALRYAEAVAEAGAEVFLFVAVRGGGELQYGEASGRFSVIGASTILGGMSGSGFASQLRALLKFFENNQVDIVHVHGVWSPILAAATYMATSRGIRLVVSPHGCLEPWALGHRKFKKRIALALYQRRILKNSSMLIATAKQELESIRRLGILNPVAVLPNGVDLNFSRVERSSGFPRNILFLSRVHPVKGVKDLILAWKKVRQPGWKIIIAGPDELGHTEELKALIRAEELELDFEFLGLVVGEKKERCFAEADLFVLPTYSENFGIAVAEALARGVPVITTTGAPWEELVVHDCGWWVRPGVEGISSALASAMSVSRSALAEMGERGMRLVEENYSWAKIGRSALGASEWVIAHNETPPFIDQVI
ncbi:GDP-mannose-dependent alpha-(1-2)-phosphatidylinositol mannosyltransferase [compost metagenome]